MKSDKQLEFIREFLIKTNRLFPSIRFRCEFNMLSSTYIIEVKPLSQYSYNESYGEREYVFTNEFESKFPEYLVMFVSDESLTKVNNPILEIGIPTFKNDFANKKYSTDSYPAWISQGVFFEAA